MSAKPLRSRGFTLIELLVTLAIAAILLMVGVPSMVAFKRNSELTSITSTLYAAIAAARGEAMKQGKYASIVPVNNGSNWNNGWIVFVDTNQNGVYDASSDTIVLQQATPMPSYIDVTGNGIATGSTPYIMFDGSGYPKSKTGGFGAVTLQVIRNDTSGTAAYAQTRYIKVAVTGRARVCIPASSSDATCLGLSSND